jgi:hypothetical protein
MERNLQLLLSAFGKEGLTNYILPIQNNINDQYYSYINLPKFVLENSDTIKSVIPRVANYIWFTKENNSKQIPEPFLSNLELELSKLDNYNINTSEQWKVNLWVNCKTYISPSLEHISHMKYPVEIIEWQSEDFGSRSYLQKIVTDLIQFKNGMGAAVDIARYAIAEKDGGFFIDFEYNTGNYTEIISQLGYHSITSTENNYFGFKPQHKILTHLNDYISALFEIVAKYDLSSEFLSLNSYQVAGYFSYGPVISFVEKFSSKKDLSIKPDCVVCNKEEELILSFDHPYYYDDDYDDIDQCSINAPEICYVADHSAKIENSTMCYLLIEGSGVDFGTSNGSLGGSWNFSD